MLAGRAVQGFSTACIMPATMALVRTYWDGAGRQRAVSMWSIGSWGLNRLGVLQTADLLQIEKQLAVNELAKLDPGVLQELVAQRRR
jgi:hypothetical protein